MKNDHDEPITEEKAAKNAKTEAELIRADDVLLDILFAEAEKKVIDASEGKD